MSDAPLIPIDDPDDPRIEDYRAVRDRDLRGPEGRPGLFLAETAQPVARLLRAGMAKSVLLTPTWAPRIAPHAPPGVPVYVASDDLLRRVAGYDVHRGLLAVGRRPRDEDVAIERVVPRGDAPLTVLLADDLGGMDNIGLLFRNAAAFAVDAVVLSPRCHDPLYRKAVRVSIGHVCTMPWARSLDWAADLARLRDDWGLVLLGADSGPGARPLDEVDPPRRVGLVVGQEYRGLSDAARAACAELVRIPMAPGVDSLNVAVASAVCLHRLSRGRRT